MVNHPFTLNKRIQSFFVLLASVSVSFSVTYGQTAVPVFSPVILYREFYNPGRSFEMKEDGTAKQQLTQCSGSCGDLSNEGLAGHRFFMKVEASSDFTQPNDLVVYSEDYGTRTILLNDKSFYPSWATWSLDGTRVAYLEYHCIEPDFINNRCNKANSGVVVGDVLRDGGGAPVALLSERRIYGETTDSLFSLSWAPDNQRLTFTASKVVTDSHGTSRNERHAYFAYVPLAGSAELPTLSELFFSGGSSLDSGTQTFSSVSRQDAQGRPLFRLAFQRLTETRPYARYDVFTAEVPAAYDGSYALNITRITNATNAKNLWGASTPSWSPDGQYFAYASAAYGNPVYDIYKIKSDGSAKAVNLTNFKTAMNYSLSWRK